MGCDLLLHSIYCFCWILIFLYGSLADVALQLQEMFEEAVAEYLKTISLNDQHQLAYYNLGYIYFNNLKRSQEGVKMLKKCLEIDPTDVDAQINMALAFNDLGMIDDVIKSYKYIIQHNDKSVMAHFNLGMCD
jgi:tetratricopeptide (TPR) repeat protein